MIQARSHDGRVEVQEPIPEEWEGQLVKIMPLTPEDALPDLDERLAVFHALGPMEWEAGERELVAHALEQLNQAGKQAMTQIHADGP